MNYLKFGIITKLKNELILEISNTYKSIVNYTRSKMLNEKYHIGSVSKNEIREWIIKKHYAHRLPTIISYSFGLFNHDNELCGICLFGYGANPKEMLIWNNEGYNLLELTRLVINDGHEKNLLSYFVGQCFKSLPQPLVLISYSDIDQNHHGYIYQATNWIYTGIGAIGAKTYLMNDGTIKHNRSIHLCKGKDINRSELKETILSTGKHRYYYFIANKKDKRSMKKILESRFEILPYPKGENIRYDASYQPRKQSRLF